MCQNTLLTIFLIGGGFLAIGQTASSPIGEETNIYQKIYNAPFVTTDTPTVSISELYQKKPLLLGRIFTRCSGVCNPFLLQLKEALPLAGNNNSVNVLIVSFDPRDSVNNMNLLAQKLALENNEQWTFAITDSIDRLTQSIGFYPVWDSVKQQYDHDALLVGINKDGYITKKLIGLRSANDLSLLIGSVHNIFSPTYRLPGKNDLFSCFNYDPTTGKNTPGLGLLFIALPAVITVLLLALISYLVRNKANDTTVTS
ncbi:MAG: SCO family protein [Bacteroidetes bacterium]|nr:SCO family protein [Bacteroidota bacterium]